MAASAPARIGRRAVLLAATVAFMAGPAPAQLLPWEVTVAEIEAGRLRGLAERLSKQNLLYQLRLGDVRKPDLIETSERIDRILSSLQKGSPSYSVPAAWTPEIRVQLEKVDDAWGPLRRIATASSYDAFRLTREFVPRDSRLADPLLLRYFDELSESLVRESETLLDLYHTECLKTGLEVCATAHTSGYAAMLIERTAKEAIYVIAGIETKKRRESLQETIEAYSKLRHENQQSPFFAEALDPSRGMSAKAAGELLESLRHDWDAMQNQFRMLAAGDLANFDLPAMLVVHGRLVDKVERMTAALVRYASLAYGS